MLLEKVLDALTETSQNQCQFLHHIIDHVIFVISDKIKKEHDDEATVCMDDLDEDDRPAKVVKLIEQWLQKVIGNVEFGGVQSQKFVEEVHVS